MKTLFINVEEKTFHDENIDHEKISGILDLGIYLHLERYKSYSKDVFSKENAMVIGAGSWNYGGTQRGVFVFRSPIHGGIHSSTMGDFGEYIKRAGYHAIVIEGKGDTPTFIIIKDNQVKFIDHELPKNIFEEEKRLYSDLHSFYRDVPFRIVLCGLGSETTKYGCLVSSKHGRIGTIPDVAGRAGGGSVLYKAHNVTGLSVGGSKKLEIILETELIKEQIEATKKYREKGTFAGNYPHLKENTIMFNWISILLNKDQRKELFVKYIEGELLKDYKFSSETCGEQCVAVCKKYESKVKIDYEPVEGLGPFIGVFNRTYIKELIHTVDSFGMDAIYLGNVLGAVFEALADGSIPKDLFSLDEVPTMNYNSIDSEKNFMIAKHIIEKISMGETSILGENIRKIGKELGISDIIFYIPHGSEFDMTPNFYWSLGLMLPIVMHGKYFSDYHTIIKSPEEYAKICAERTLKEYTLDNLGICRFHRGWVEGRLQEDILKKSKYWIAKLWEYKKKANALPGFPESKRAKEVIKKLFEEKGNNEWSADENKIMEYWKIWKENYLKELEINE